MDTMLWRTSRGARIGVLVLMALCLTTLTVLWTRAVAGGAPPVRSATLFALIGAAVCTVMWWSAWLPYVAVAEENVLIRNVVRRHRVPLRHVTAVTPGFNGLELQLAHGTDVTAWAVQKANISRWLGRHTRADDVAAAIMDAARAAGATIASDEGLFWLDSPDLQDR